MKNTFAILALLAVLTVSASVQQKVRKSVFGVNTGISIPFDEFAVKAFTYDAGFSSPGPNLEVEYLYYGKVFGFSSSVGYSSLFFNERSYQAEYDRTLNGYGTNDVSAGNYQVLKFLVGFTLKIPEFNHTEVMVFASDHEGGFGGFDLWYSVYNGQNWLTPVNMGGDINTEYDEYRLVVVSTEGQGFLNDLMIFSSNRPGGKGGFDLYYAGIPHR